MQDQNSHPLQLYQLKDDSNRAFDAIIQTNNNIANKLDLNLEKIMVLVTKHDLSITHINKILVEDREEMKQNMEDKFNSLEKRVIANDKRISDNDKFKFKLLGIASVIPVIITVLPYIIAAFAA
nr:hypothetical protein [Moritella viscosa]SHO03642.1 Protein-export membrane protein SecD [Moritella viscosa]